MTARAVALLALVAAAAHAMLACGKGDTPAPDVDTNPSTKEWPPTGDTKTFDFTITEFDWEVAPGAVYDAIGYGGTVPGPPIEVTAGDHVVVHLTNHAKEPHSIHTHVSRYDSADDGVTSGVAQPGQTVTVQWDVVYAGTFPYHDHAGMEEALGVSAGLYGAVISHAPDEKPAAHENLVVLSDMDLTRYKSLPGIGMGDAGPPDAGVYYPGGHEYMHVIDGKAYPENTPHFRASVGDLVRWRVVSIGSEFHTFHVHGHRWVGADGVLTDNVQLGPGTYTTFDWIEDNPGDWLYHCHVPDHMMGGMMGMYSVAP